jgi:hypothetical protein
LIDRANWARRSRPLEVPVHGPVTGPLTASRRKSDGNGEILLEGKELISIGKLPVEQLAVSTQKVANPSETHWVMASASGVIFLAGCY